MSEVMQQGILRMPPECWMNGEPLDERQRHSAYVAAADRILELEDENAALREDKERLDWLEECHAWPEYIDAEWHVVGEVFSSYRAAIDAAIAAARKEAKP